MNHWMRAVSLVGILSTAVVCGTDTFFLTIGRPALTGLAYRESRSREAAGRRNSPVERQCQAGGF